MVCNAHGIALGIPGVSLMHDGSLFCPECWRALGKSDAQIAKIQLGGLWDRVIAHKPDGTVYKPDGTTWRVK